MSKLNLHDSVTIRRLYVAAGLLALMAGLLGLFLPLLPTTPFVLLAAACFARGSERCHGWLMQHHFAGPIIRDWYEHRSIRPGVKRWALLLTALSFGSSILVVGPVLLKVMLGVFALILCYWLWSIPIRLPAEQ